MQRFNRLEYKIQRIIEWKASLNLTSPGTPGNQEAGGDSQTEEEEYDPGDCWKEEDLLGEEEEGEESKAGRGG